MTIETANPPSDLKPTHKRSANRLLAAVQRSDYDLIERHLLRIKNVFKD